MRGSSNSERIMYSNKNLLDNWDFTNPVNQREQTSYQVQTNAPSRVYTIDRWALSNISTKNKLVVSDNKITCSLSGLYSGFYQIVPFESSVMGEKTVTLSIIAESYNANLALSLEFYNESGTNMYTSNNITLSSSNAENVVINGVTYKLFKTTITLTPNKGKCHCYIINLNNDTSIYSISLIAVKLELGEVSTLKNDILGVNYSEELIKCKQYLWRINAISDAARLFGACAGRGENLVLSNIMLPDNFRKTDSAPVIEYSNSSHFKVMKGLELKSVTSIQSSGVIDNSVTVDIYSSGIITGEAYSFVMNKGSWIQFSKEL